MRMREMFGREFYRSPHWQAGVGHRIGPEDADDLWQLPISPLRDRRTKRVGFRTKRLIAVPPLRAKHVSVATWGNTRTSRATRASKASLAIVAASGVE